MEADMSARTTFFRSLHDVGLAAWFGGNLMGAVGLNGATAKARNPRERLKLSSIGWARWAPVQLVAMVVHGIGGIELIIDTKARLAAQHEARVNTAVKTAVTLAAIGTTVASAALGSKMAADADEPTKGVTEPGSSTSEDLAAAQRLQKVLQWATPVLTGVLLVLAAQQGEQQRPFAGLLSPKHSLLAHLTRG
jgi:succinate dehydrogenase hydrophobic anchor subunit